MSPTIYNINNATIQEKMASFDYDWTMVNPTDGKTFPSSIDDWQWMYSNVPEKIKQYYEDGYMIVVFSNQSKKWKCDQIQLVLHQLNIPLFVVIATEKCDYKPNPILFNTYIFSEYFIAIRKIRFPSQCISNKERFFFIYFIFPQKSIK